MIYGVSWQTQHFIPISIIFRKNNSTDFCLSYLADKISKGFDSSLLTGVILIDLQKAFDTTDHMLLLKMALLGFSHKVLDWYKSYLSSRKFHVPLMVRSFTRIHSWTFVISVVCKQYATRHRLWSISLCRWYIFYFNIKVWSE